MSLLLLTNIYLLQTLWQQPSCNGECRVVWLAGGRCWELAATVSAELQQSRNSCSGRRAELHEGCFGRGPCCATEKACMPGYISRGFAAIVMNLPRPLKGLPALNDLEPKRRASSAESPSPHREATQWTATPFIPLFTLSLFVITAGISLSLYLMHTFGRNAAQICTDTLKWFYRETGR